MSALSQSATSNRVELVDLPLGMRTWIYENAQDVTYALLYLMKHNDMFRMVVFTGKLQSELDTVKGRK